MFTTIYHRPHGATDREECYYIESDNAFDGDEQKKIEWLIRQPLGVVSPVSVFKDDAVVEIGPRRSRITAFSSTAVANLAAMGVTVRRVEMSTRYLIKPLFDAKRARDKLIAAHFDQMVHEVYPAPLTDWGEEVAPEPVGIIPVLEQGRKALEDVNRERGLGFDKDDTDYNLRFVRDTLTRNPTTPEVFLIGNGNSDHSRHLVWNGLHTIAGTVMPESLMDIAKDAWKKNPGNSRLAFNDNGGALGRRHSLQFVADTPWKASSLKYVRAILMSTATAETHNHPTLISAFEGAATGPGGRMRDNVAIGKTAHLRAGVAGYAVANCAWTAPRRYESPLSILIKGSNGASDYQNKLGEPLIGGFATEFDMVVNGKRRAYVKPILYTGGIGVIDETNLYKVDPEVGMLLVRIGGPAYPVGIGGGAASSMQAGANTAALDYQSVQRADPQMGNRAYRALRACAEMRDANPIESIHDQGAGGPLNMLIELMGEKGGQIDIRKIVLGDRTMSVIAIGSGEYQEGYGVLVRPQNVALVESICAREGVNCEVLGEVTGTGRVVVTDSKDGTTPVDLPIEGVLTGLPRKRFVTERLPRILEPFVVPSDATASELLCRVFGTLQGGSKRFLTNKADRSVTGLVAQQQCVGPFQLPLANAGIMADGYRGYSGTAEAVSVQNALMLVNPAAGARMALVNAFTKLVSAGITSLADAKFRVNWMWPAKEPGELASIYDAASSLRDAMVEKETAGDGGKDSSSMAVELEEGKVLAPGTLVLLGYAPVKDFRKAVTPETHGGVLGFVDFGKGKNRLGGSLLLQTFGVLGNEAPDIDDPELVTRALVAMLRLIRLGYITAYHKRSGGGLLTTLAELCMAGNCGAAVTIGDDWAPALFSEEAGFVFECASAHVDRIQALFKENDVPVSWIGATNKHSRRLTVRAGRSGEVFSEKLKSLRKEWEARSLELQKHQSNPDTVQEEAVAVVDEREPAYRLTFVPERTPKISKKPRAAVLREQGTNGDREMAAALVEAGFDVTEIHMADFRSGVVKSLDRFQMLALAGGFSNADAFGSGKGWAGGIRYNPRVKAIFDAFFERPDTLSLGVCNGAQVHPYLGVLPFAGIPEEAQPRFVHNTSAIFESRWATVKVLPSPAVLFREMEGSVLGVHVAHGEGRLLMPDPRIAERIRREQLAPLAYVGPDGETTEAYPYNPNGSPNGWTALCSTDGRHLAMMPHPERAFLPWQWHWMPRAMRRSLSVSPWLQFFQNGREWCSARS
jgi:phosphoribosylformylglycinamidine synthase